MEATTFTHDFQSNEVKTLFKCGPNIFSFNANAPTETETALTHEKTLNYGVSNTNKSLCTNIPANVVVQKRHQSKVKM